MSAPWVEGADGRGEGETIVLHLSEQSNIHKILIYNGYLESQHLYEANGKTTKIQVDFGEGSIVTQDLPEREFSEETGVSSYPDIIEFP